MMAAQSGVAVMTCVSCIMTVVMTINNNALMLKQMKLYTTLSVLGCFLVPVACTQETTEQRSASGRAPAESRTTKQTTPLPPRSEDANNQTNEDQDSTAVAAKFTMSWNAAPAPDTEFNRITSYKILLRAEGSTDEPTVIKEIDVEDAAFDPLNPSAEIEISELDASALGGANACLDIVAVKEEEKSSAQIRDFFSKR